MASPPAVISTRCLPSPLLHGYLLRRTFSKAWVRYWCVIQGGCLHCYLTPDDHVSVDVTELDGYSVTSHEESFPEQRFVLHLEHEDYIPVYLSASCKKEMEEWKASLTSALKVIVPTTCLTNQRSEAGGVNGSRGGDSRSLVVRQKLLAEVLRQTQELERKQSSRLTTTKHTPPVSSGETPDSPLLSTSSSTTTTTTTTTLPSQAPPPPPTSTTPHSQSAGEQICTRTRLRQRRMSAQIKLDTLQRQIQTSSHNNGSSTRKSIFSFVKKKSSSSSSSSVSDDPWPAPHSSDIVRQLKVLSDRLTALDRDLVLSSGGLLFVDSDRVVSSSSCHPVTAASPQSTLSRSHSSSRRSSNSSDCRVPAAITTSLIGLENGCLESGAGSGSVVMRSNSLKSSVQKLAHKTFAKAGWYRSKKSSQSDASAAAAGYKEEVTPPGYDVNPDVIDLSHHLRRTRSARDMVASYGWGLGRTGGVEEGSPPSPPSPFKGSPSPTSPTPRPLGTVSSEGGRTRRHSTSASLHGVYDDPKSPSQRINPAAIAHIEEFEELSRQILGEALT